MGRRGGLAGAVPRAGAEPAALQGPGRQDTRAAQGEGERDWR